MVSSEYVVIPCSVLGFGALFGGIGLQGLVLDFNEVFSVFGVVKLIPRLCLTGGIFFLFVYLGYGKANSYRRSTRGSDLMGDFLAKIWFIPPLSRDIFSGLVLDLRGKVKSEIEDGHLEHSFGGEGV